MSDTTTTDTGSGATTDATKTDTTTQTTDTTAELATLKAQIADLQAKTKAAEDAAEAAKREKMSDAEKLAADRAKLDADRNALTARARTDALNRLGVIEKAHGWAPNVDPATPDGAKQLEDWAKANPELVKRQEQTGLPSLIAPSSPLADVLSGKKTGSLLSPKHAFAILQGLK